MHPMLYRHGDSSIYSEDFRIGDVATASNGVTAILPAACCLFLDCSLLYSTE